MSITEAFLVAGSAEISSLLGLLDLFLGEVLLRLQCEGGNAVLFRPLLNVFVRDDEGRQLRRRSTLPWRRSYLCSFIDRHLSAQA